LSTYLFFLGAKSRAVECTACLAELAILGENFPLLLLLLLLLMLLLFTMRSIL
jgi:hypothetical protein